MKKNIHPKYYENVEIQCACGAKFIAGSVRESIKVEVCSNCHPFYTGEQKFLDTSGRVAQFEKRRKKQEAAAKQHRSKKQKRAERNKKKQDKNKDE